LSREVALEVPVGQLGHSVLGDPAALVLPGVQVGPQVREPGL